MNQNEVEADIENEYFNILYYDSIYQEKVNKWNKLLTINQIVSILSVFAMLTSLIFTVIFQPHFVFLFFAIPALLMIIASVFYMYSLFKFEATQQEFGLTTEELLFLKAYEMRLSLNDYLSETNTSRKKFHQNQVINYGKEIIELIDSWGYGNIKLIKQLIGEKIDILKKNFIERVMPTVIQGDNDLTKKIRIILLSFCEYLLFPSIDKINKINTNIMGLPLGQSSTSLKEELKTLSRIEILVQHFRNMIWLCRLTFSFSVLFMVAIFGFCLGLDISVLYTVSLASFFGSIASYDKIFTTKKEV